MFFSFPICYLESVSRYREEEQPTKWADYICFSSFFLLSIITKKIYIHCSGALNAFASTLTSDVMNHQHLLFLFTWHSLFFYSLRLVVSRLTWRQRRLLTSSSSVYCHRTLLSTSTIHEEIESLQSARIETFFLCLFFLLFFQSYPPTVRTRWKKNSMRPSVFLYAYASVCTEEKDIVFIRIFFAFVWPWYSVHLKIDGSICFLYSFERLFFNKTAILRIQSTLHLLL